MEIEPRPLTRDEQSVLDRLLSVEFDGVAELREQAEGATVTGLCDCGCPSVDLGVNSKLRVPRIRRGCHRLKVRSLPQTASARRHHPVPRPRETVLPGVRLLRRRATLMAPNRAGEIAQGRALVGPNPTVMPPNIRICRDPLVPDAAIRRT